MDGKRVVSYARQSLARSEEESLSIAFQEAECAAYIIRNGGILVGTFSDPDTKGWRRHRPGFDAMLDSIKAGQAQVVCLFKLSRFARNLMMQEEVVAEIANAGGELVSITEPHITTSPMIRQILGAVNENYRRDQSDWLRSTFAARARKGLHHGYAPFGYRLDAGLLVVDDLTGERARQMWQWGLEGHGTPEITYRLNERHWTTRNGKPWAQTTVLRVLRNPTYAGHVQHRGEIVARDTHPAIVTDAEYHQVQGTIDRRSYQRRKASPSWAEGFVYHACGSRMYLAGWNDGGEPRTRFRCKGVWAPIERNGDRCTYRPAAVFSHKVEAGIIAAVLDLAGRVADVGTVRAAIEHAQGATDRDRERHRTRLERRLVDLDHQRQRLLDLVLTERIDADLYGDRDDALKAELATVRGELATTPAIISAETITRQHLQLSGLLDAVRVLAESDPAALVPTLSTLEARYVIGEGDGRLQIAEPMRVYFV